MKTKVVEIPNAWGWKGLANQSAFQVLVLGQLWGTYCYLGMALAVADRIEKVDEEARCRVKSENG